MDLSQLEEVTCSVSEEIDNFCHRQSWLNKVKLFIDSYSSTNIEDYLTPKKFKVCNRVTLYIGGGVRTHTQTLVQGQR